MSEPEIRLIELSATFKDDLDHVINGVVKLQPFFAAALTSDAERLVGLFEDLNTISKQMRNLFNNMLEPTD